MSEKKRTKEYLALFDALVKPKKREPAHPLPDVGEVERRASEALEDLLRERDPETGWIVMPRGRRKPPSECLLPIRAALALIASLKADVERLKGRRTQLSNLHKHMYDRPLIMDEALELAKDIVGGNYDLASHPSADELMLSRALLETNAKLKERHV